MGNGLLKGMKALFSKKKGSNEISYEEVSKGITWKGVSKKVGLNEYSEGVKLNEGSKDMTLNEELIDDSTNHLTDSIASNTNFTNDNSLLKALQEELEQKRRIAYDQIENQFIQSKSRIDKIARSADCSLDQAFLFCLFHQTGTRKFDDENFCSALMKYLGDKKMMEFKSIQEIKIFLNGKVMFLGNVDFFESIDSRTIGDTRTKSSFSNGNVSIFNNVYLFNRLTIDDFEHILNNEEPNPIHDFHVEFYDDFHRISFYQYSFIVLRIRVKNEDQKNLIIRSIDEFDEVSKSNRLKDHLLLETKINDLGDNLTLLFTNLVSEIPRGYLLYPDSRKIIEHIILSNAYLKELLFEPPFIVPRSAIYLSIYNQPKENIAYLRAVFEKLNKILTHKMDIEINLIPAFIWMALKKQVIIYFANEWEERFGIYFKNIAGDYTDFIKAYCEIEEINILDAENIGLLTTFLMNKKFLPRVEGRNYYYWHYEFVKKEIELMNEIISLEKFENKLMRKPITKKMDFNDIDLLTGYEFEEFIEELFTKMGYLSARTKGSGDQGIDVLAEKDGRKFGIQTKCYGSKVNNSAVQEAVAGIAYYNCDRGIVITNNYFTRSAIDLAAKNDIILWDRDMLKEKFTEFMN